MLLAKAFLGSSLLICTWVGSGSCTVHSLPSGSFWNKQCFLECIRSFFATGWWVTPLHEQPQCIKCWKPCFCEIDRLGPKKCTKEGLPAMPSPNTPQQSMWAECYAHATHTLHTHRLQRSASRWILSNGTSKQFTSFPWCLRIFSTAFLNLWGFMQPPEATKNQNNSPSIVIINGYFFHWGPQDSVFLVLVWL